MWKFISILLKYLNVLFATSLLREDNFTLIETMVQEPTDDNI